MKASDFKVGDKIRIGKEYAQSSMFKEGQLIELEVGVFEHENGLYVEDVECLAWRDQEGEEWESIYHLFGNKLNRFKDCEIIRDPHNPTA